MGLYAPVGGGGGEFRPIPAGTYFGTCTAIIDLGLQPGSAMYPKPKHVIVLRFEVPNEQIDWGEEGPPTDKPAIIYERFTFSMNSKALLRAALESWRGRAFSDEDAATFDIEKVLGKPATISVVHNTANNGRTYANIATIGPLPKGMQSPPVQGELVLYHSGKKDQWDQVPEFLKEKIRNQARPLTEDQLDEQRAVEFAEDPDF